MSKFLPCRVFTKIWREKSEALGVGAEADAGFDAGEFSGAYHGSLYVSEFEKTLEYVAKRFDMEPKELDALVYEAEMKQFEMYYPYH